MGLLEARACVRCLLVHLSSYFLERVLLGTLKIQSEGLIIFLLSRKRRPFW